MIPGSAFPLLLRRAPAVSWTPAALFAAGEQGFWFDASDLSTLFQDAAGSVPVTAAGQPVRRILDKSGRGNHATAPSDGSRPTLQVDGGNWYLSFDGTDDCLSTSAINLTGSSDLTICAGITENTSGSYPVILEINETWDNSTGGAVMCTYANGSQSIYFGVRPNGNGASINIALSYSMPLTRVMTSNYLNSSQQLSARINGAVASTASGGATTGNYGTNAAYIGSRNNSSLRFSGRIYQLVARNAATSSLTQLESYIAGKSGVTL